MAKIMLVEDDNNLREIYEARLLAEGYEIVAAKDGEEALALAVKEKPDLIISDVMMPKISGFDMLDILRSTPETKDTKVIMMTALSQTEDKGRADKLGADRYLVKSQVTLEDVAKVAHDVLSGDSSPDASTTSAAMPAIAPEPTPAFDTPTPDPVAAPTVVEPSSGVSEPTQAPADTTPVVDEPTAPAQPIAAPDPMQPTTAPVTPVVDEPVADPITEEVEELITPTPAEVSPEVPAAEPTPITVETSDQVEATPEAPGTDASVDPQVFEPAVSDDLTQTTEDEESAAESQINDILAQAVEPESEAPLAPPPASEPIEEVSTVPEPAETDNIEVAVEPVAEPTDATPVSTPINVISPEEVTEAPTVESVAAPEVPAPASTPEESSTGQLQDNTDSAVTGAKRVIQPISDITAKPDINELLKAEETNNAAPIVPAAEQVVTPNTGNQPTPPPSGSIVSPNDISL